MASFNESIKNFNTTYYRSLLRIRMWTKWNSYQTKRFAESYWPAFFYYKEERKSNLIVLKELIYLFFKFKCLPFHYFRYSLYRKKFTFDRVLEFYPETLFYYKDLPKINSNYVLLDDKNIFESIIKGSELSYPQTILKKKNGSSFDSNNNFITSDEDLKFVLNLCKSNKIFAKPASYSSGGKGILLIEKINNCWRIDGEIFTKSTLDNLVEDWIFQEGVTNCKQIAQIHNKSVNSFRVLTVYKKGIGAKVIYVSLKLGTSNSYTDNAHTGGLYVGVDYYTGQLTSTGYDENLNEYNMHPNHDIPFKDIKIKNIQKVVEYAEKVGNIFSDLAVVGWDIALTDEGPSILEGNSSSGLTIFQRPFNGLKTLMDAIKPLVK